VIRERFAELQAQPEPSPFGPLLQLQYRETNDRLRGEVYASVDHPFPVVRQALVSAEHWCQILILHLNVKYSRATQDTPPLLDVGLGRKFDQPLKEAYWLRFTYRPAQVDDDYLRVVLSAPTGPMGTRNYLIAVEAASLDAGHSVVHLTYSYTYDTAARLAMKAYLATLGRAKVGFSVVGRDPAGQPKYAEGVRGAVERNIMRYYLAIEAFLGAESLPEPQRQRRRLEDWFDATERHARQLHEVERNVYLKMKEQEIRRQETQPPPGRKP
jgi:hypothetical protein